MNISIKEDYFDALRLLVLYGVVLLLSLQGQKALRFHQYILICVPNMNKDHMVWNDKMVSN